MTAGLATASYEIYASLSGVFGNWASVTGGEKSRDGSYVYDGGDPVPSWLPGRARYDAFRLVRPYEFPRDREARDTLDASADSRNQHTLTIIYEQNGIVVDHETFVVTVAKLTRPEGDAASSAATSLATELMVTNKA